jgi:hypothetical protein
VSRIAALLALLLAPGTASAEALLLISAEGDVRVLVDGQSAGDLRTLGTTTMAIEHPTRHVLQVETHSGELLDERSLNLEDGESIGVHWNGEKLSVMTVAQTRAAAAERSASNNVTSGDGGQQTRRPSTMQTAQAGSTAASLLAPTNPVVAGVSTGLTAVNAGSTLVRAAQNAADVAGRSSSSGPSATSANENHDLEALQQSGFDPYEAAGGRPSFDASLASVTFVAPAGTQALINMAGQPVGSIADGATEITVPVVPGMHKVMIFDVTGVDLLHRGYLTTTAGHVLEIHFSTEDPPVCNLPDSWR